MLVVLSDGLPSLALDGTRIEPYSPTVKKQRVYQEVLDQVKSLDFSNTCRLHVEKMFILFRTSSKAAQGRGFEWEVVLGMWTLFTFINFDL